MRLLILINKPPHLDLHALSFSLSLKNSDYDTAWTKHLFEILQTKILLSASILQVLANMEFNSLIKLI